MKLLALISYILLCTGTTSLREDLSRLQAKAYRIDPVSVLTVNGSTNLNEFCCLSNEDLGMDTLYYRITEDSGLIQFERSGIALRVDQLDCGNRMMNKDLRKTLQSEEFPFITIELLQASNPRCPDLNSCTDWTAFLVTTSVTIGCNTVMKNFEAQVRSDGQNGLRVYGDIALCLSDFEITAPVAMLGLVKVRDQLQVGFDLEIQLQ